MKIDLNESLERKYFNEAVDGDDIWVEEITDFGRGKYHESMTVVFKVSEELNEKGIEFMNNNWLEEGDGEFTDIYSINYDKGISDDGSWFELKSINVFYDGGETTIDNENDCYELISSMGLTDEDFEEAFVRDEEYFDY